MISGIEQQLNFAKFHHGSQGRHESLQTKDHWAPALPTGINMRTRLPSTRRWIRHWHVVGMFSCSPPIPWESNDLRVAIEMAECPF
jgi:hypothetical protein